MSSTVILLIALVIASTLAGLIAVLSFRTSVRAVHAIDESHARNQEYTKDLLDRLMSMDFNSYKAYTMLKEPAPGYVEPEPVPEVPVRGPDRGGFGSKLGLRALTPQEVEEELTDENR